MKNLSTITWAHAVNNKTYLEAALASNISMLEADVVMGRINGKDGPAIPIMAHPPATTSDLSLGDFLAAVAVFNKANSIQKGVKLDFKSTEAFQNSQEIIAPYAKPEMKFPLWLNADIIPGPVAPTVAQPVDPNVFFQLGSKHPRAVLSAGWTTRFGGDVTTGEYTHNDVGRMIRLMDENNVTQTVTFAVRAGLASNSQPVLLDLLREMGHLSPTLTVWSSEGDPVSEDRLRALLLTVGLEKVYLDVPRELQVRLALPTPDVTAK